MKKTAPSSKSMRFSYFSSIVLLLILLGMGIFLGTTETGNKIALLGIDAIGYTQNLADPYYRYIRIPEGWRKEQIADAYSHVLAWNDTQKQSFLNASLKNNAPNVDGYFFPETYIVPVNSSGSDISKIMIDRFNSKVTPAITSKSTNTSNKNIKNKVNLDTAVKIASIIQREAGGKSDMRLISGVIWNRLFSGMALGMDATLQYAVGNAEDGWWPQVTSSDKNVDSPYNTYKNKGLPPTPIANPGLAAIEAAFNPQVTDCLFYLHDNNGRIHCSKTYAEHKRNIEIYLK